MGTALTKRKMLETMMMGMTEMKPSRIALRYLLRAMALKKGLPFSMSAMSFSMDPPFAWVCFCSH